MSGSDLSSRAVSSQVLSALKSLTAVFGMGTGGTSSSLPPDLLILSPFCGTVKTKFAYTATDCNLLYCSCKEIRLFVWHSRQESSDFLRDDFIQIIMHIMRTVQLNDLPIFSITQILSLIGTPCFCIPACSNAI